MGGGGGLENFSKINKRGRTIIRYSRVRLPSRIFQSTVFDACQMFIHHSSTLQVLLYKKQVEKSFLSYIFPVLEFKIF